MAPDADATAGASQGWHDLEAVLAKEPAATLLAAYLVGTAIRLLRRRSDAVQDRMTPQTRKALVGIRGVGPPISPEMQRGRQGGLCRGAGRCARTRKSRDTAAASLVRCRGAGGARSAAETTSLPWC